MKNEIYPCLWFDGQGKEAATFYCSIFNHSKIISESPMAVKFEIEGKSMMCLNGGPMFKINPSISLFVSCQSTTEIEQIWNKLIEGGKAMMALDNYPWAEKYGWVVDKFGMTWQLMLTELPSGGQKIMPSFLFVGEQYGKAEQAIKCYTALFPNSTINNIELYKEGEPQPAGNLKFGNFSLNKNQFAAMDGIGAHEFNFNEGVSLVVECETQSEIDLFWNTLSEKGSEGWCGWLKDEFGVSWQIIPSMLGQIMSNPEKGQRAMQALMKMKKLDIDQLMNA